MAEALIAALSILGYFVVGASGARGIFSWAVRTGNYERGYLSNREDVHMLMTAAFVLWPLVAVGVGVWGMGKLLRSRPPESKRDREEREKEERIRADRVKRDQAHRIRELEKALGIAQEEGTTYERGNRPRYVPE